MRTGEKRALPLWCKKKSCIVAILLLAMLIHIFLSVFVFAAFIGSGMAKGVLIGNSNFFASNVLNQADSVENALTSIITCNANEQNISIRNYDLASGNSNTFSVNYDIYCWLSEESADTDLFTYYYTLDGINRTAITSLTPVAIPVEFSLQGRHQSINDFVVGFQPKNPDDAQRYADCGICVAAVPTSPGFMTRSILAGTIIKSFNSFSVQGSFNISDNDINNMAGFLYEVLSSGLPDEGQTVTLQWDAAKLELDIHSPYLLLNYVQGTEITENGFSKRIDSITFEPTDDHRYFSIAFFRETDNAFWQTATWENVESLVSVRLNTP